PVTRGARHPKKSHGLLREAERVMFAFMQAEKAHHPVRAMSRALGVSASGFYAWQRRPASARACTDQRLRVELRAAHAESGATYGSPRLQQVLRARGLPVGR